MYSFYDRIAYNKRDNKVPFFFGQICTNELIASNLVVVEDRQHSQIW